MIPIVTGAVANSVSRGAAAVVSAVDSYFTLPPRGGRRAFDWPDLILLLVVSALLQGLYLAMNKITFECDALTLFDFAKGLAGQAGAYLPYRGPGFPAFLVLTGQPIFHTFYGTILVHALFGVAAPTLVYLTLRPVGRVPGLLAAGLFIASSLPFTYAKLMLPQQLFMFLVVAALYSYSRFYFTRHPQFIYVTLVLGLLATLTRGEGLPLTFVLGALMLFLVFKERANMRHLLYAGGAVLSLFLVYSGVRSLALNDASAFGSLSNWGGRQLFLQPYAIQKPEVVRIRQSLLGTMNQGDPPPVLVHPDNGPASRRFYQLIVELYSDPASYSYLEPLLSPESVWGHTTKFEDGNQVYHHLFGRFAGRPEDLARNVFEDPSQIYFDNLWRLIDNKIGIRQSDALFRQVSLEAIKKNPELVLSFAHTAFWYVGFDLISVLHRLAEPGVKPNLFRSRNLDNYLDPVFDGARCASDGLPRPMFLEYEAEFFSDRSKRGSFLNRTLRNLQAFRVLVITATGLVVLLFWWVLPFSKDRELWLGIGLTALLMLGIIAAANRPGDKYEPALQALMMMIAAASLYVTSRRLRGWIQAAGASRSR